MQSNCKILIRIEFTTAENLYCPFKIAPLTVNCVSDYVNAAFDRRTHPFVCITYIQVVPLCNEHTRTQSHAVGRLYVNTECERENGVCREVSQRVSRTKKTDKRPNRSDSLRAVRREQCNALCISLRFSSLALNHRQEIKKKKEKKEIEKDLILQPIRSVSILFISTKSEHSTTTAKCAFY